MELCCPPLNERINIFHPLSSRRLSVKPARVLQMDEDVLCVRHSPDGRLLAVSLLDCTVKIFFVDTLKVKPAPEE